MKQWGLNLWAAWVITLASGLSPAAEPETWATLEEVPVGIAAAADGRVFVSFSRAIDPKVKLSVAQLKDGRRVPFPPSFNQGEGAPAPDRLLSVQALVVDPNSHLWMLDSGKVGSNPVSPGAPQLIAYDLRRGILVKRIPFSPEIAGPTSFLNDLRIDFTHGPEGTVFITDASPRGPAGLIVVDIAQGTAVRRLSGHTSTRPEPNRALRVEGKTLVQKQGPETGKPFQAGADGLALSADNKTLFFSPLTSHSLYQVSTDALVTGSEEDVEKSLQEVGDKGFASDGLLTDSLNRLYATDVEGGAIRRLNPDGKWELVAQSKSLSWPDSLALLPDGTLLVTATQVHRSARFRGGDQRARPFQVLKISTDSQPREIPKVPALSPPPL